MGDTRFSILDSLRAYLGFQSKPNRSGTSTKISAPNSLNCRVVLDEQDIFNVQICGIIYNRFEENSATAQVSILDITDGTENALPVYSRVKQWQMGGSESFQYNGNLGNLKGGNNMISNWVPAAKIYLDWLNLARKGNRNLLFEISILSGPDKKLLISSDCVFGYDNPNFGYNDLKLNIQRAKTLAVSVLPTPDGPKKINEPIGRVWSEIPVRERRIDSAIV